MIDLRVQNDIETAILKFYQLQSVINQHDFTTSATSLSDETRTIYYKVRG